MKKIIPLLLIAIIMSGCRGWRSDSPPIHPNINFDFQPKINAQTAPIEPPPNTIPYMHETDETPLSSYSIDDAFIRNGQKNFNIYCAACHTKTGNGLKSITSQNGWLASNLLDDTSEEKSNQYIYNAIQNGIRSMPAYGKKLNNKETWEVVLYVRALQAMTRTSQSEKKLLKKKGS